MNLSITSGVNPVAIRAIFSLFTRLFRDHPAKVGETYIEHVAFALGFSLRLFRAGLAALLHGVVPALCETTASSDVLAMTYEIRRRRAQIAAAE